MDLSKLRLLIAQAREDDEKATPGPWKVSDGMLVGPKRELVADVALARYPPTASEVQFRAGNHAFLAHVRSREPVLARALEAALEVVEMAEHARQTRGFDGCDVALSRFRAVALETEA